MAAARACRPPGVTGHKALRARASAMRAAPGPRRRRTPALASGHTPPPPPPAVRVSRGRWSRRGRTTACALGHCQRCRARAPRPPQAPATQKRDPGGAVQFGTTAARTRSSAVPQQQRPPVRRAVAECLRRKGPPRRPRARSCRHSPPGAPSGGAARRRCAGGAAPVRCGPFALGGAVADPMRIDMSTGPREPLQTQE